MVSKHMERILRVRKIFELMFSPLGSICFNVFYPIKVCVWTPFQHKSKIRINQAGK